jgi:hypothetical protein
MLVKDRWPIKEPTRMEERERQLTALMKSWIHPVFARQAIS